MRPTTRTGERATGPGRGASGEGGEDSAAAPTANSDCRTGEGAVASERAPEGKGGMSMGKRKIGLIALAAVITLAAAACSSSNKSSGSKPLVAAWIYVGSKSDAGWTQQHDLGRLAVEKAYGSKVTTIFKENVPEGPQVASVINQLINDGAKIIFSTSFGFQDAMAAAAKAHPDVYFEQATGTDLAPNLSEYFGAGE